MSDFRLLDSGTDDNSAGSCVTVNHKWQDIYFLYYLINNGQSLLYSTRGLPHAASFACFWKGLYT